MKKRERRPTPDATALPLRRGDVVWVDCEPSIGVEPTKVRTCVIVSNDVANEFGAALTLVPTQAFTTERAARAYMVDLRSPRSTLDEPRVANASMVTTFDRRRVLRRAGRLGLDAVRALDIALSMHLGLDGGDPTSG